MKLGISITIALFVVLLGQIQARRDLQKGHAIGAPEYRRTIQIEERSSQNLSDDPFLKRISPEQGKYKKGDQKQLPQRELLAADQTEQAWVIYKPFQERIPTQKQKVEQENQKYINESNQLLKFGIVVGSIFLLFVFTKTCMRKRGRREIRRMRQGTNRPNIYLNPDPQIPQQQQVRNPQSQPQNHQNLDQRIKQCEMQLNKLKLLQKQALRQQFNNKLMEEQQRKIQMINQQRIQNFQIARRNNLSKGYGPQFYGQHNIHYAHSENQVMQPFQVKGVQPIRRQRSNSFKTEVSEQPMMKQQIRYRNGIPIGKPVRHNDNDSSFASEYPQV